MPDDPLSLDAEQMRRMGYAVVDMLVDRLRDLMADAPDIDRSMRRLAQTRLRSVDRSPSA